LKKDVLEDIAQFSRNAPTYSDADIEDAMSFQVEEPKPWQDDDLMMDDFDDAELEAMIASYEEQQQVAAAQQPKPASLSDDDYDEIFTSMISQDKSSASNQPAEPSEDMELADEDFAMLF
jgi:hypothetical protein